MSTRAELTMTDPLNYATVRTCLIPGGLPRHHRLPDTVGLMIIHYLARIEGGSTRCTCPSPLY